ncbi:hypothetical protein ACFFGH_17455 [Lysobacter korlensis]|uniref:Lipoprotein n=1 Tax=Lysobacter korlensis TaxID=553636 RepID=A0ABV6RRM1_9GAMM
MSTTNEHQPATAVPGGRKWKWIYLAGAACLLSWVALGIGIAVQAGTGPMVVLTTLAALTTEGLVWVTALVFGISAYSARRELLARLLRGGG